MPGNQLSSINIERARFIAWVATDTKQRPFIQKSRLLSRLPVPMAGSKGLSRLLWQSSSIRPFQSWVTGQTVQSPASNLHPQISSSTGFRGISKTAKMSSQREDSIPHELRTAAEPRQNRRHPVRLSHVEQINPSVRLLHFTISQENVCFDSFDAILLGGSTVHINYSELLQDTSYILVKASAPGASFLSI